jgi:hypothetical protein
VKAAACSLAASMVLALALLPSAAAQTPGITVTLEKPNAALTMGDTPTFRGFVKNTGGSSRDGLVVFLTIINLEPGNEQPIGLEDWSANPSVRVEHLVAGAANTQNWTMRLVQAGSYAAALTVIDHSSGHPVSSELVPFTVASKPTLQSARVLPIAIGEPLFLILLVAGLLLWRSKTW